MKYRTILVASSAFLNSNQRSSNTAENAFWTPALSLGLLLAPRSPESAHKSFESKTSFPPSLPWPGPTGYGYFCYVSEETDPVDGEPWPTANAIPPRVQNGEARRAEFILQLLGEAGRRGGHCPHCGCYCKDRRPEAGEAHHTRGACPTVKPAQREALLRNGEQRGPGDWTQRSPTLVSLAGFRSHRPMGAQLHPCRVFSEST